MRSLAWTDYMSFMYFRYSKSTYGEGEVAVRMWVDVVFAGAVHERVSILPRHAQVGGMLGKICGHLDFERVLGRGEETIVL